MEVALITSSIRWVSPSVPSSRMMLSSKIHHLHHCRRCRDPPITIVRAVSRPWSGNKPWIIVLWSIPWTMWMSWRRRSWLRTWTWSTCLVRWLFSRPWIGRWIRRASNPGSCCWAWRGWIMMNTKWCWSWTECVRSRTCSWGSRCSPRTLLIRCWLAPVLSTWKLVVISRSSTRWVRCRP